MIDRDTRWTLLAGSATVIAGLLARRGLEGGWARLVGKPPPRDPDLHENGVWEALAWSVAVAGVAGVARIVARRGAVEIWTRVEDGPPPLESA
jgi:hypothetical protein